MIKKINKVIEFERFKAPFSPLKAFVLGWAFGFSFYLVHMYL